MDWASGNGQDVCKPIQLGRWIMLCFALLTRCRVIRPHVEDQLPHELHEQVTLIQGPLRMEKNVITGIPVRLRELVLSWLRAGIKSIWPLSENEGCPEHRYNEIVDKLHAGQRVSLLSTTLTRTVAKYFASLWGIDMPLCDAYANRACMLPLEWLFSAKSSIYKLQT